MRKFLEKDYIIGKAPKQATHYIIICLISLILLTGLNSFFFILKEAFGFGQGTFMFTSEDRFADIIKVALSYKEILVKIPNFENRINNLSSIYQNYFYNNPYGGILNINGLTHFHLTPISSLLGIIVGTAIGYGLTPGLIMFILFFLCVFLSFASTYNIVRSYRKSLLLVSFITVSYPLLMIVTRGNYQAFFCAIGVLSFLISLFINKKVDFVSLFLFAVAINFRPNALILIIAFPLLLGIKKSIWPIVKLLILSFAIYIFTYLILNYIYPDYTFATFLKALSVYNKTYIVGYSGLAFNSSMFGLLQIFGTLFKINISIIMWMFYILSFTILLVLLRLIFKPNSIIAYYPFILSSIYILINPVAADYHLLIFIFPIFIIYNNYEYWQNDRYTLIIITLSTLLLLAPKNYIFINGISLQVIINPLIMLSTTIYLFYKNEIKQKIEYK